MKEIILFRVEKLPEKKPISGQKLASEYDLIYSNYLDNYLELLKLLIFKSYIYILSFLLPLLLTYQA